MGVSTEFRSIYRHGFARVAACTTRCTLADPAANARGDPGGRTRLPSARRGACGIPRTRRVRLRDQRPAASIHAAGRGGGRGRGPGRASAELLPLLLVGAPLRHAGALYNCALAIHRGRLLGVVPKVHLPNYREFYEPRHFVAGDGMVGGEITIGGADRAVRHRPAVRGRGRAGPDRARRDLRGHLDPGAAELAGGTGRRDGARQPVRQQHHDRQGGDAAPAVRLAIGALRRGVSVRRGRCGRIHHRSRLGRPGLDLRERCDAGRDRALSHRPASSPWPISTSTCCATSACRWAASTPTAAAIPRTFRRIGFRLDPPAGDIGLERKVERFPFVPADPARLEQDCYEAYNIQVSGPGAAAARHRHQARGDRRVGRARFHPRADRVRAARSTCSGCRAATSLPTRCPASPPPRTPRRTRSG